MTPCGNRHPADPGAAAVPAPRAAPDRLCLLAVIGIVLQFLSPWVVLLLAVQIAFQLNEERVPSETFPEYADYKKKTPMLLPGIY